MPLESHMFDMIYAAVRSGEPKMVGGNRCFLLSPDVFLKVLAHIINAGHDWLVDARIAAEGYENLEVSMGALNRHRYWLITKMDPMFDSIWEKNAPKELVETRGR